MMKKVNRAERLFHILSYLNSSNYVTASELADLCGTSIRTIYRDMRALEEIGVFYIHEGRKGYQLIEKPVRINSQSQLTVEEWMALSVLPLVNRGSNFVQHPLYQAYRSGMEKIRNLVNNKNEISSIGSELGKRIRLHDQPWDKEQFVITPTLIEALLTNHVIEVTYYSIYRDEMSVRELEPYYLIPRGGNLYVIAYCRTRQAIRLFRLSRIQRIKIIGEEFQIPETFDIDKYLKNRWSVMDEGKDMTFKVKFNRELARYVSEREFYSKTEIVENADGSLLLTTTVKSGSEFLNWVRSFGLHAEVLEPEEIRQQLHEEYTKMVEKYH